MPRRRFGRRPAGGRMGIPFSPTHGGAHLAEMSRDHSSVVGLSRRRIPLRLRLRGTRGGCLKTAARVEVVSGKFGTESGTACRRQAGSPSKSLFEYCVPKWRARLRRAETAWIVQRNDLKPHTGGDVPLARIHRVDAPPQQTWRGSETASSCSPWRRGMRRSSEIDNGRQWLDFRSELCNRTQLPLGTN
jgi:hypothetical protein